jgi:hypothetical protein
MKKIIVSIALSTALAGCLGGGSTSPASTSAASSTPATTTQNTPLSIDVTTANANAINNGGTASYTISGSYGTTRLSGSGTATTGAPTSVVLNGIALLKSTSVISETLTQTTSSGYTQTTTNSVTGNAYYNSSNYYASIYDDGSSWEVMSANYTLPTTIKAGDTGNFGDSITYTNSSKTTIKGTSKYSWSVASDTATSLLLTRYIDFYDTSNVRLYRGTTVWRENTNGTEKTVSTNYLDLPATGSQTNLTRTFQ